MGCQTSTPPVPKANADGSGGGPEVEAGAGDSGKARSSPGPGDQLGPLGNAWTVATADKHQLQQQFRRSPTLDRTQARGVPHEVWARLPPQVLVHVLSFLDPRSLQAAACTCLALNFCTYDVSLREQLRYLAPDRVNDHVLMRFGTLAGRVACLAPVLRDPTAIVALDLRDGVSVTDGALIPLLAALPGLETINLAGCAGLSLRSIEALSDHCHNLVAADLRFAAAGRAEMDEVLLRLTRNCPALTDLNLGTWLLSDTGLLALRENQANLSRLTLSALSSATRDYFFTDEGIRYLTAACPRLQRLELSYGTRISEEGWAVLLGRCRRLQTVHLRHCHILGLPSATTWKCVRLTTLLLSDVRISDTALAALGGLCPELRTLSIRNGRYNADTWIRHLLSACRHLAVLDLYGCPVGDRAAQEILRQVDRRRMAWLNLSHTNITDTALNALLQGGGLIRHIDVADCPKVRTGEMIFFYTQRRRMAAQRALRLRAGEARHYHLR